MVYKDLSFSHIKIKLAELAIFFIAFDSSPFFPGGATYRPLSIFPLLLYFCFYFYDNLLHGKIRRFDSYFIIFFIYLFTISLLKSLSYSSLGGVIDFFITGFIGIIFIVSFNDYFRLISVNKNKKELFDYISVVYERAMIIPLIYGTIQILEILLHIYIPKRNLLYHLATTRFVNGRVFLVCGEPAWASVYLMIYIFFLFYSDSLRYKKLKLVYSFILFFLTFSMFAYLAGVLVIIIYFLVLGSKQPKVLMKVFFFLLLIIVFFLLIDRYLSNIESTNYAIIRYKNLKQLLSYFITPEKLYKYIQTADDSVFIRFMNPIIGFMMSFHMPLFGTGAGYYYEHYPIYIKKYFPLAIGFSEVRQGVNGAVQMTSRSLFAKFFAEYGIVIGGFLFYIFFKQAKHIKKSDKCLCWLFSLMFMTIFQFDSLCYTIFLFLLTFYISLDRLEV